MTEQYEEGKELTSHVVKLVSAQEATSQLHAFDPCLAFVTGSHKAKPWLRSSNGCACKADEWKRLTM